MSKYLNQGRNFKELALCRVLGIKDKNLRKR
jgi:hypothetical protein